MPYETREKVKTLLIQGLSYTDTAKILGLGKSTISYHANMLNLGHGHQAVKKPCGPCVVCGKKVRDSNKIFCSGKCRIFFLHAKADREWIQGIHMYKGGGALRNALIRTRGRQCERCKNAIWMGKGIPLECHHLDGNSANNKAINLQILCPNCHAQTSTYKSKNKGNGRHYRRIRYQNGSSY